MSMGIVTRGRTIFAAILIVVLTAGLVSSIGWAQDATPDIDSLDEICATLEASPESSPASDAPPPDIGTPETDTAVTGIASPESDIAIEASPAAELEEELCGTPGV